VGEKCCKCECGKKTGASLHQGRTEACRDFPAVASGDPPSDQRTHSVGNEETTGMQCRQTRNPTLKSTQAHVGPCDRQNHRVLTKSGSSGDGRCRCLLVTSAPGRTGNNTLLLPPSLYLSFMYDTSSRVICQDVFHSRAFCHELQCSRPT